MDIKIRKQNQDGLIKVETRGDIKEVLINEDFLNPKNETISICFRGKNSSGIVDFSPDEFEKLYNSIKNRLHLIRGFKRLS